MMIYSCSPKGLNLHCNQTGILLRTHSIDFQFCKLKTGNIFYCFIVLFLRQFDLW